MAVLRLLRLLVLGGLCVSFGLGPLSVVAQPASVDSTTADTSRVQWVTTLPPLTVTASRLPTAPSDAPAHVTVLDSSLLHAPGTSTLADALDDHAGLFVRRSGAGGLATPSLRGSGASQTTLLLDGQRLSDPQIGHIDLSLFPTVLLRSAEVMHGPASSLHGSDGLGGAIQLHSLRAPSSLQVRGMAQAGAFGQRGGSLLVGAPLSEHTSVLTAVDAQATDGDFPYTDEARFPTKTVRRQNADRVHRSAFGRIRSRIGAHRLQLSGWGTWAERGLPPTSSTTSTRERQWDTHLRLWGEDRFPVGDGSLTVQGMSHHTRIRYANPSQNLDQTGRTWTSSLESTLRRSVSSRWMMASGLTGSYARAQHPKLNGQAHQQHAAAFAEGTGRYGPLRVYPALRADTYWMPESQTRFTVSPRLGLNLQPAAWPDLYVKTQVGRAFRVPTFNDRYWQPGGNPALRPERSWGGDAGLGLDRPQGHAVVTVFGHWRRNQIVWEPTGEEYWSPKNVKRVRALGFEATVTRRWSFPFGPTANTSFTYTLTDARDRTDPEAASYDEPLRYVPRDQLKTRAALSWGPVALTVEARYTGRRYVTSDGSESLNGYVVTNTQLRLSHDLAGVQTELALRIDNLFDVDYQSVGNRPMPPRHTQLRLLVAPY